MLKIFEVSDYNSFQNAVNSITKDIKLILSNVPNTIHYLSLQYFQRLFHNFEHIPYIFILNTDNDLTVCLEAIDLLFPYIIFSGEKRITTKLKSRASKNECLIFPTLKHALNFIETKDINKK